MEQKQDLTYVTIELSKKQADLTKIIYNEKTKKDYVRIFAPGGGSFFYPTSSLKIKEGDNTHMYFTRPQGAEIQVHYSERIEDVPDTASNEEKYHRYTKTIKIEDLKEMYQEERQAFIERQAEKNNQFVNMTVPSSWGTRFESNGEVYVSISVPAKGAYASFILPESRFHQSDKEEGMSYFGFPRYQKDQPTEEYMVKMRLHERQEDGTYLDTDFKVSAAEVKNYVDSAKEKMMVRDMFVSCDISSKLIKNFQANNKELVEVAVPIYENPGAEKAAFYKIVVSPDRVMDTDRDNVKYLSLFKNSKDGTPYTFNAKKSVKDENNKWQEETREMTSEEVIKCFKESSERYRANRERDDQSLADELNQTHQENQNQQQDPAKENYARHMKR